ncbi:hypothetical protein SLE2022_019820 [Rubroshorea leprosula]
MTERDKEKELRLERKPLEWTRRRSWETQERPSTDGHGLLLMECILQLVKPILENPEPEQQPDRDHHQYEAGAQHTHSPATHLRRLLLLRSLES